MNIGLIASFQVIGLLSVVAVFVFTQDLYGNWFVSFGSTAAWILFFLVYGFRTYNRLAMPIDTWKTLARRFPRGARFKSAEVDTVGRGSLDGVHLIFELVARKGALTVKVCWVSFLWRNTLAIPWNQIEIRRVGTNQRGHYVAAVSFPQLPDCEMVLPWLKKFAKYHDRS